jgi:DNA-binding transcriptional ArsR family regulator
MNDAARPLSPAAGRLDAVFDALANEHRREIVRRLAGAPMTTPAMADAFGFTKQALSRHLGVLEHAGLVRRTPRGRLHELALVPQPLDRVRDWVVDLRRGWEANLDRL